MKPEIKDVSANVRLHIDSDGRWYYGEQEIIHPRVLQTFQDALKIDDAGRHYISLDGESCQVDVDGAPLIAVSLRGDKQQGFRLVLNSGQVCKLDPATLRLGANGGFYASNPQGLAIRFTRAAHVLMAAEIEELADGYALTVEGLSYRVE